MGAQKRIYYKLKVKAEFMEMCSRCGLNPAMVFIMRQDASGVKNEGLCLPCAKEMGIKLPKQMEEANEMLENLAENMQGLIDEGDDDGQGKAPMIDMEKLNKMFFGGGTPSKNDGESEKSDKKEKSKNKGEAENARKSIDQFCINLTGRAKEGKLDRVIGRESYIF